MSRITRKRKADQLEEEHYSPSPVYNLQRKRINDYIINHSQCQEFNDKFYLVNLNPYNNEELARILPIFTNINDLDDGIYIYVLISLNGQEKTMYFMKTFTIYEMGTKHQQLIHRIACSNDKCKKFNLYYSGEFHKMGNTLFFNFYSGTFKMEDKLTKKRIHNDIEYVRGFFHSLGGSSYDVQFVNEPIITKQNILFTANDLEMFKSVGASIYEFGNYDECKTVSKKFQVSASFPSRPYTMAEKIIAQTKVNARRYGGTKKRRKQNTPS